jgi:hypothetical protein
MKILQKFMLSLLILAYYIQIATAPWTMRSGSILIEFYVIN